MKKYFYSIFILVFTGVFVYSFTKANDKKNNSKVVTQKSFYDLTIKSLDGKQTLSMSDFKGKFVLIVNVASECGYTPQYAELQQLSDTYKDKLVVIGFPCNQFLGQESGTPDEISAFCKKNYGVTFPLTEKIEVKGSGIHPIYSWLTQKNQNGVSDATIKWNFNKFLIDPAGNWLSYFPSSVKPLSEEITSKIK